MQLERFCLHRIMQNGLYQSKLLSSFYSELSSFFSDCIEICDRLWEKGAYGAENKNLVSNLF